MTYSARTKIRIKLSQNSLESVQIIANVTYNLDLCIMELLLCSVKNGVSHLSILSWVSFCFPMELSIIHLIWQKELRNYD